MKKLTTMIFFALMISVLAGCGNTIEGVGEDIQEIGRAIQD